MFKDYLKAGIIGGLADYDDSSCQFNKKLLPLSLKGNYGLDENDLNFCNEKLNRQATLQGLPFSQKGFLHFYSFN